MFCYQLSSFYYFLDLSVPKAREYSDQNSEKWDLSTPKSPFQTLLSSIWFSWPFHLYSPLNISRNTTHQDLSTELVLQLLMMDMESFSTITSVKPNSIPMSTALRQAKASASKAEPTITCRRDLETKTSPFTFRTTIPEAYLKPWQSNGASKLILRSCPKVFSNSHSHQQRFLFLFNQNDHKPQPEKSLWRFVYLPNTQALRTENTLEGSPRHITMSICSSITSGIYRILSASSVSKVLRITSFFHTLLVLSIKQPTLDKFVLLI